MKRKEPCVYCGESAGDTRDHVPPKGLFSKPRPSDLVTVPCCNSCRQSQGVDDEYCIRMIVMKEELEELDSARKVLESVHRSFGREEMKAFNMRLAKSVMEVEVRTASGLYVGVKPAYRMDLNRLEIVVSRTTRGLYWFFFGDRLPDDHVCSTYFLEGFRDADDATISQLKNWIQIAKSGNSKTCGGLVYKVWVARPTESQQITIWFHLFYDRVGFVSLTHPIEVH